MYQKLKRTLASLWAVAQRNWGKISAALAFLAALVPLGLILFQPYLQERALPGELSQNTSARIDHRLRSEQTYSGYYRLSIESSETLALECSVEIEQFFTALSWIGVDTQFHVELSFDAQIKQGNAFTDYHSGSALVIGRSAEGSEHLCNDRSMFTVNDRTWRRVQDESEVRITVLAQRTTAADAEQLQQNIHSLADRRADIKAIYDSENDDEPLASAISGNSESIDQIILYPSGRNREDRGVICLGPAQGAGERPPWASVCPDRYAVRIGFERVESRILPLSVSYASAEEQAVAIFSKVSDFFEVSGESKIADYLERPLEANDTRTGTPLREIIALGRFPDQMQSDDWRSFDAALSQLQSEIDTGLQLTPVDTLLSVYGVLAGGFPLIEFQSVAGARKSQWLATARSLGLERHLGIEPGELLPDPAEPEPPSACVHRPIAPENSESLPPPDERRSLVSQILDTIADRLVDPKHHDDDPANNCGIAKDFTIDLRSPALLTHATLNGVLGEIPSSRRTLEGGDAGELLDTIWPSSGFCAHLDTNSGAVTTYADLQTISFMMNAGTWIAGEARDQSGFSGWWRIASDGYRARVILPVRVTFSIGREASVSNLVIHEMSIADPPHGGIPDTWPSANLSDPKDNCNLIDFQARQRQFNTR